MIQAIRETRVIHLPKGGELELELTPAFYEKVRQHYGMQIGEYVDDDRLRMFVFGALDSAVNKAEVEIERE